MTLALRQTGRDPKMETAIVLATFIGAVVQVAIGIGFSVVAGPVLVIASGARAAVPTLLALNIVVSLVGIYGFRLKTGGAAFGQSIAGALLGILIGTFTFPYLSETFVEVSMAVLLLGGSMAGWISPRREGWKTITGAGTTAGLATAWTATPGPVMALGLVLAGHEGAAVRRLVQPISLITYGVAFGLLGRTAWSAVADDPNMMLLVVVTVAGGILGLVIGPRLPSAAVVPAVRVVSAVAGFVLLSRAFAM